jgi:hypothetical protein
MKSRPLGRDLRVSWREERLGSATLTVAVLVVFLVELALATLLLLTGLLLTGLLLTGLLAAVLALSRLSRLLLSRLTTRLTLLFHIVCHETLLLYKARGVPRLKNLVTFET